MITEEDSTQAGMATAVFSEDRAYRYVLTRRWDERPPAVFVMLNPSTADAFKTDATVTRCARFARRENCGGLIVVNLFALRATNPRRLRAHYDPVGEDNDALIREQCRAGRRVIAAWGTQGSYLGRDEKVLGILKAAEVAVHCLGETAGGMPRHPLYLPAYAPVSLLGRRPWPAESAHDALRRSAREAYAIGQITEADLADRMSRIAFMESQG